MFSKVVCPVARKNLLIVTVVLVVSALACNVSTAPANVDVEATVAVAVNETVQAGVDIQATVDAAIIATNQARQPEAEAASPMAPISATPIPVTALPLEDVGQVQTVINNEVSGVITKDLGLLQTLYTSDAVVTDHSGTPDDPADDTVWRGWANIQRRYEAFFSSGPSTVALVGLSIQVDGNQASGVHQGVVLDGTLHPDVGIYQLEKRDGVWLITGLEYGNLAAVDSPPAAPAPGDDGTVFNPPPSTDVLYDLRVGSQHRYEEPWGWDRGDPCTAWDTDNFDDTKPYYRGFNVELLLTNNSNQPVPDNWPVNFTTSKGKTVMACYYGYPGSGPAPGETSSVTFFTVVDQGDYVSTITFSHNGQTTQLCLDGFGGWWRC